MADPLTIAALSIAVVQIADRVIGVCKFYIENAKDAPSDLNLILNETSTIQAILKNLEYFHDNDRLKTGVTSLLVRADGPIEGYRRTLAELEDLFPKDRAPSMVLKHSKKQKLDTVLTALAWPLKKNRVEKLLDDLGRHKVTMGLAVTADSA